MKIGINHACCLHFFIKKSISRFTPGLRPFINCIKIVAVFHPFFLKKKCISCFTPGLKPVVGWLIFGTKKKRFGFFSSKKDLAKLFNRVNLFYFWFFLIVLTSYDCNKNLGLKKKKGYWWQVMKKSRSVFSVFFFC